MERDPLIPAVGRAPPTLRLLMLVSPQSLIDVKYTALMQEAPGLCECGGFAPIPARLESLCQSADHNRFQSGALRPVEVEPVQVHDFIPDGHEVLHELLFPAFTCVDLGDGPKLRV